MLIITRKETESLLIDLGGEQIEITVMEAGKQVRLGIAASSDCKIWRKELYSTIEQNKAALTDGESRNVRELLQQLRKASE